ncbi:hypothetical protein B0J13DRAFT_294693 [Dactylonectria estremocensis]|uniref:Uncharacterized protein n=1 Tax=Dactylonectria estremocensis TaxID=1079267 RepID=A0A9P9CZK7_9HYPO|nr:hypothetical protein B0J13DRAFT_294693 [Dactylonectria estremocensis]
MNPCPYSKRIHKVGGSRKAVAGLGPFVPWPAESLVQSLCYYAMRRACSGTQCFHGSGQGNKHFPANGEIMQKLVTYSAEGNRFDGQEDVPQFIRDMIDKNDRLRTQRKEDNKKRKRDSFSDRYPIHITNVLPGPSNQALAVAPAGSRYEGPDVDEWNIPEPRDDAIKRYCMWHCARIRSEPWKASFQRAATITFQQGLDLKHVYEQQSVDLFINDDKAGILPGIAQSWVQDVKQWVDELKKRTVQ